MEILKLSKVVLAILLVFSLLIVQPVVFSLDNIISADNTFLEQQQEHLAAIAYTNLIQSFQNECVTLGQFSSYMVDGLSSGFYPGYYAGAYVNYEYKLFTFFQFSRPYNKHNPGLACPVCNHL